MKKIAITLVTSVLLALSFSANADPVSVVFNCKLNDGATKEEAMAVNSKWLKWAREAGGSDEITSSYVSTVIGELGGFMWVDTYPDLATWAKVADIDFDEAQPELAAAFDELTTCSRTSMYQGEETQPAK
jgi:hypothetical protein